MRHQTTSGKSGDEKQKGGFENRNEFASTIENHINAYRK